jgi:serine/threonine protein kinase
LSSIRSLIVEHELLPIATWDETRERCGPSASDAEVVERLEQSGSLTHYQSRVLSGQHDGPLRIGNYLILDEIGGSNLSVAYRARNVVLQREVVVRLLHSTAAVTGLANNKAKFLEDCRLLSTLRHENIATTHDAGIWNGTPYVISDRAEGQNLLDHVGGGSPLTSAESVGVIQQTARALAHLHQQGQFHERLTPGCLVRTEEGHISLIGLQARHYCEPDLRYTSPELISGQSVATVGSEIHSLGCCWYFLLRKKHPFDAPLEDAVITNKVNKYEIPSLAEYLNSDLESVYQQMMAFAPEERQQSMLEVVEQLGGDSTVKDSPQPPKVFISYRRSDSALMAAIIYDRLVEEFGVESVFFDIDHIPIGSDFRKVLHDAVTQCSVLIVLMGDRWVDCTDEDGRRRLDNDDDFVRIEVECALERNIPVVPVMLGHQRMPTKDELPPSLQELRHRHAAQIVAGREVGKHIDDLVKSLRKIIG